MVGAGVVHRLCSNRLHRRYRPPLHRDMKVVRVANASPRGVQHPRPRLPSLASAFQHQSESGCSLVRSPRCSCLFRQCHTVVCFAQFASGWASGCDRYGKIENACTGIQSPPWEEKFLLVGETNSDSGSFGIQPLALSILQPLTWS